VAGFPISLDSLTPVRAKTEILPHKAVRVVAITGGYGIAIMVHEVTDIGT
jgi:hypothetical protein